MLWFLFFVLSGLYCFSVCILLIFALLCAVPSGGNPIGANKYRIVSYRTSDLLFWTFQFDIAEIRSWSAIILRTEDWITSGHVTYMCQLTLHGCLMYHESDGCDVKIMTWCLGLLLLWRAITALAGSYWRASWQTSIRGVRIDPEAPD
jgi:hypothetical protein